MGQKVSIPNRHSDELLDGESMTDVCRDLGISRKTG
jgi:hypothetical protein